MLIVGLRKFHTELGGSSGCLNCVVPIPLTVRKLLTEDYEH